MSGAALATADVAYMRSSERSVAAGEPGPVAPHERIQLLDVLRGFALFGILQVNWLDYGKFFDFVIDGSFYTMFSFLFGLGFSIQLLRAQSMKRSFAGRYLWRTTLLFLIGAAHFVFIWRGDIVRVYGMLAVVLLLVRRWPRGALVALAAACLLFAVLPRDVLPPRNEPMFRRPDPEAAAVDVTAAQNAALSAAAGNGFLNQSEHDGGSWLDQVRGRADALARGLAGLDLRWLKGQADILCMFILGLVIGRMRVIEDPLAHTRFLIWVCAIGLVVGVVGNTLDVFGESTLGFDVGPFAGAAYSLGNIGLCFFYLAALILLIAKRPGVRRVLAPLGSVGRMGLTNYLMQSVCLTILLMPIGFGLADRFPGRAGFLILDAFFVVQILYSRWWFARYRFGPVEWAWRSLTWGRRQLMRVGADA